MMTQAEAETITVARKMQQELQSSSRSRRGGNVQRIPRGLLTMWNLAMTLFHAGLTFITLYFGNRDLSVPMYKTNITLRTNANGTEWELIPSYVPGGEFNFTWLTATFFFLSSLFHFLNATVLRSYYLRNLADCRSPTRYLEYTLSASVMQVLIAYSLGVRERLLLLSCAVLVGITMPFGVWVEDVSRPLNEEEWELPLRYRLLPWWIGNIPQTTAWLVVILSFYDGGGGENAPAFVSVILWGELLLFFSFGFVALYQQMAAPRDFYKGELAFQSLSLFSKGLLGGILIANVLMLSSFEEIYS